MANVLSVVLIGSGNVATQLGRELHSSKMEIKQVVSFNGDHARQLAGKLGAAHASNLKEIYKEADWYIIAVNDDKVEEVANQLNLGDKIVCHTSGTVPMEALKNASRNYGVFYPLQTFSKEHRADWQETPICIEGNDSHTIAFLDKMALAISREVHYMNTEKRRWVHLAAVWANNFTNFLLAEAEKICDARKIPFEILKPLMEETLNKAFSEGARQSQTGPAIRGDHKTIENQLKMLDGNPEMAELYKVISGLIGKGKMVF